MGKLLFAAMVALVAITYSSSPEAVQAGIGGVVGLTRSILQGGATGVAGTGGGGGSKIVQLPDGSYVQVPEGYQVQTSPSTTAASAAKNKP